MTRLGEADRGMEIERDRFRRDNERLHPLLRTEQRNEEFRRVARALPDADRGPCQNRHKRVRWKDSADVRGLTRSR